MTKAQQAQSMRPFFIIWSGQAVSLLGSQLVQFALVWWLARTTGSATALALAGLAALLPQVIIAPFAGALADRWNRRRVMILADSGIAVATLLLALLFWANLAAVWTIYLLLVVRSAGNAFHWPAMQASTTMLVPQKQLARAAGLNQALGGAVSILIPPLGALAMETLPMQAVLAIDVVTAIPAVTALLFVAIPQPPPDVSMAGTALGRLWEDMRQGLRFVLGWKGLLGIAIMSVLIHLLGRATASLIPLLVLRHYQGGAAQLGWLQSVEGIGVVAGGVLLGVWGGGRSRMAASLACLALDGVLFAIIGLSSPNMFWLALIIFFVTGLIETVAIGLQGAIGQAVIPPAVQGRVFALVGGASQGLAPLGLLAAGPTADALGVPFWFTLSGIVLALVGGGALLVPNILHIEEPRYGPPPSLVNAKNAA